jgi:hypothetical protein
MFLRKIKLAMTAAAVMAVLAAAGAVVLAQSGIGGPKDGTAKPQNVGSPNWTYHIMASRDGEPPRKVAVVEITDDTPVRVDAPGALILIQPERQGVDPPAKAANGKTASHPEPTYIEVRSVRPSAEKQTTPPGRVVNYGLKYQDFDRLMAAVKPVTRAVPIREIPRQIRNQGRTVEGRVMGTTHDYAVVTGLEMDRGRFLTDADNNAYQNYVIISSAVAQALFPEEVPIGKSIKVGTDYYTVIGVAKQANQFKDNVYIPLNTCKLRFGERIIDIRAGKREAVETQLSRLILEIRDGADVEATAALVKSILEPQHPKGDVEVVILKPDRKTK